MVSDIGPHLGAINVIRLSSMSKRTLVYGQSMWDSIGINGLCVLMNIIVSSVQKLLKFLDTVSTSRSRIKKGLRYSILLELPYFDPIYYTVVDPMHKLFLGTGKHMMEVWLADEFISRRTLDDMERLVSQFIISEGIGCVPSKISNLFGGLTADQWKNWITIYSSVKEYKKTIREYNKNIKERKRATLPAVSDAGYCSGCPVGQCSCSEGTSPPTDTGFI